jgi:hypothetical protein
MLGTDHNGTAAESGKVIERGGSRPLGIRADEYISLTGDSGFESCRSAISRVTTDPLF